MKSMNNTRLDIRAIKYIFSFQQCLLEPPPLRREEGSSLDIVRLIEFSCKATLIIVGHVTHAPDRLCEHSTMFNRFISQFNSCRVSQFSGGKMFTQKSIKTARKKKHSFVNPQNLSDSLIVLMWLKMITGLAPYKMAKSRTTGEYSILISLPGFAISLLHLFVLGYNTGALYHDEKAGVDVSQYTEYIMKLIVHASLVMIFVNAYLSRKTLVTLYQLQDRLDAVYDRQDRRELYRKIFLTVLVITLGFTAVIVFIVFILIRIDKLSGVELSFWAVVMNVLPVLYIFMTWLRFVVSNWFIYWNLQVMNQMLEKIRDEEPESLSNYLRGPGDNGISN